MSIDEEMTDCDGGHTIKAAREKEEKKAKGGRRAEKERKKKRRWLRAGFGRKSRLPREEMAPSSGVLMIAETSLSRSAKPKVKKGTRGRRRERRKSRIEDVRRSGWMVRVKQKQLKERGVSSPATGDQPDPGGHRDGDAHNGNVNSQMSRDRAMRWESKADGGLNGKKRRQGTKQNASRRKV